MFGGECSEGNVRRGISGGESSEGNFQRGIFRGESSPGGKFVDSRVGNDIDLSVHN